MAVSPTALERNFGVRTILWFSTLFSLVKSRTIVYGFALAALGTFFIASGAKIPDFLVVMRLTISVYFLALATYLYNDLTDYDVDRINNRDTASSSKKMQYHQILYPTIGFFAVSVLLAFSINILTGIGSLAFLGLAIAYSHPRIHLKDLFVIKTIVTAAGGFIASLMGALAAQHMSYLAISSSLIVFLIYFINGPLNDIRDIEGDRKGGRRTIPIVLGVNKSFMLIISSIFSIAGIIIASNYFLGIHLIGSVMGLVVCAYLVMQIKKLSSNYENKKKMNQTRTTVRNSIFTIQISLFLGLVMNEFLMS